MQGQADNNEPSSQRTPDEINKNREYLASDESAKQINNNGSILNSLVSSTEFDCKSITYTIRTQNKIDACDTKPSP